jgi:hypothetical protein
MLKILYAASNNQNARIQLERFLQAVRGKPYIIKIAAYQQSTPCNVSVDWTLNCLLNMFKPETLFFQDNENLQIYYEQVKYFNPDLIISDLEHFTSYIAGVLNIRLWQCSSSIINYALTTKQKYSLGLHKRHAYTFSKNQINTQRTINILNNSSWNGVYSHLGDSASPPTLKSNYQWVRPYHQIGKTTIPCRHNIVAGMLRANVKILDMLKRHPDCVAFMHDVSDNYQNIILKPLDNQEEYFCNLKNCNLFMCAGQTSFLADAFYNGKHAAVITDYKDAECILNSEISENFGHSTCVHNIEDLIKVMSYKVEPMYAPNIKYLHQKLEEL